MTDDKKPDEKKPRRARGEHSVRWDNTRQRYVAEATVGYRPDGKRITRKAYGTSESAALKELRKKVRDYEAGLSAHSERVTVAQVVEDWLEHGQGKDIGDTTREKNRILCETHIIPNLGARKVRELTADEVDDWLATLTDKLATSSISRVHGFLKSALRRAMRRRQVDWNVAELCTPPKGKAGRPSKSLTLQQAKDVITQTVDDPLYCYIVVSLLTGARTEEVRALKWEHVHLSPDKTASPPIPPHMMVWRSVREGGDTKTKKSKRTLAIPDRVVVELRGHKIRQAADRLKAGKNWKDNDLVFCTSVGTELDAANVRRSLRRALKLVPGIDPKQWTPRELRHSFVSVLSDHDVPVETIAQLVGHKGGSTVTETVYRHQLKPVIQAGALVMDDVFGDNNGKAAGDA